MSFLPLTSIDPSFSKVVPFVQLEWSANSLGAFKTCPRFYFYSKILGLRSKGENVHLVFGGLVHKGIELFFKYRIKGLLSHDDALELVCEFATKATWDAELGRPISVLNDPTKNRMSLLRVLIWYLDKYRDDNLKTLILANGDPAVELPFSFDTGLRSAEGEPFLLSGRLDRIVLLNGEPFDTDVKTTGQPLDEKYFAQFSPDNQLSTYTSATKVQFDTQVKGIILDAIRVESDGYVSFQRKLISRTPEQIDEWYSELPFWIKSAERCAQEQSWPQNDKACFRCDFRGACQRPPQARDAFLEANFIQREFNVMETI